MYTASDIRNVEFSKNMGGYKVAEVVAFAESCADTVEVLTAEKEELTKKLGILADKLVEYRRDEDSIRSALLSAQRTGDAIIREANENADQIVSKAKQEADEIVRAAKSSIAHYEAEMKRLKEEVSEFRANVLSLYKEHLALLKVVPSVHETETEAPVRETVVEPAQEATAAPVQTIVEEAQEEEEPMKIVPEQAPVQPHKSKFANLKFGEDYNLDDDNDQDD